MLVDCLVCWSIGWLIGWVGVWVDGWLDGWMGERECKVSRAVSDIINCNYIFLLPYSINTLTCINTKIVGSMNSYSFNLF